MLAHDLLDPTAVCIGPSCEIALCAINADLRDQVQDVPVRPAKAIHEGARFL